MKIVLFIGGLSGGGAERVMCNLAASLARSGHEVKILTVAKTANDYHLPKNVKHECLENGKRRSSKYMRALEKMYFLMRFILKSDAEVYVVMLPLTIISLMIFRKLIKVPIIISERCDPETYCSESWKNRKAFLKYYSRADGYVFQTDDAKAYYQSQGINVSNSRVIPNAVNSSFVREPYLGKREKRIISVGRLTEQKNYPLLIRAFAKISIEYPEHTLTIYGEGPMMETYKSLAKELELADRINFPGFATDIISAIQRASLFVLPSNYEGMPNALSEAMALGLPCIATDCPVGGPRYLIEDGENGLLIPRGGEVELIEAMRKILGNEEYAAQLGRRATGIIERLNPEKIYGQWEEVIINACGGRI